MKKILIVPFFILIIISCSKNGLFLTKFDFSKGDWLLVHSTDNGFETIKNKEVLIKYSKELIIRNDSSCIGTTPDYYIDLYKDGERLIFYCYCDKKTVKFGELSKYFVKTKLNIIESKDYSSYETKLDSIKRLKNIYIVGKFGNLHNNQFVISYFE
jgi:hypothetical protein